VNETETNKPIVFYDGDCGFCNASVQFILAHKKEAVFFATLQGQLAENILASRAVSINLDTIYYLNKGKLYNRSSAILQICKKLKGAYPLLYALYIIPKFIRDPFYNAIAKRRHRIKNRACLLPTAEERQFFLKA
jgi:predicted DCC family thiol-disulfide oxidoreductase YuxK